MNGNDASPLYTETPSTSAPYSAGVVSDAYLEQGLNAEATENEKNGGLPDQTMKAVYSTDHTLILQGTFPAYTNQTIPIKIHGPSPAVEHIQTQQITTDAYGNFKLTVSSLDVKEHNLYVDVREDYAYWISVEAGRTAISDYTE